MDTKPVSLLLDLESVSLNDNPVSDIIAMGELPGLRWVVRDHQYGESVRGVVMIAETIVARKMGHLADLVAADLVRLSRGHASPPHHAHRGNAVAGRLDDLAVMTSDCRIDEFTTVSLQGRQGADFVSNHEARVTADISASTATNRRSTCPLVTGSSNLDCGRFSEKDGPWRSS
jgi:hypothetical protein